MRPRVLVVEDARLTLRRLAAILQSENFEVQAVASRREAAIALQQRTFDLLITDMNEETPASIYGAGPEGKQDSSEPEIVILVSSRSTADWQRQGVKAVFLHGFEAPRKLIAKMQQALDDFVQVREFPLELDNSASLPHLCRAHASFARPVTELRIIVPHRTDDVIDGFRCSMCQWCYWMKDPKPYEICWRECSRACVEFDAHVCSHYPEMAAG